MNPQPPVPYEALLLLGIWVLLIGGWCLAFCRAPKPEPAPPYDPIQAKLDHAMMLYVNGNESLEWLEQRVDMILAGGNPDVQIFRESYDEMASPQARHLGGSMLVNGMGEQVYP